MRTRKINLFMSRMSQKTTLRKRVCKRCNKIFLSETKYRSICDNCQKPRGYHSHKKYLNSKYLKNKWKI